MHTQTYTHMHIPMYTYVQYTWAHTACMHKHKHTTISWVHSNSSNSNPSLQDSFLLSPFSYLYVSSSTLRTLAPNNINTFIHLLSPTNHVKLFQNCFAHATKETNQLKRAHNLLVALSFCSNCPRLRIYCQILYHQLFVLVLFLPSCMIITFIWNKIGLIYFSLLSVLGFSFCFHFYLFFILTDLVLFFWICRTLTCF